MITSLVLAVKYNEVIQFSLDYVVKKLGFEKFSKD